MCHLNSRQELILIHKSMPKSRPSRSAFASSVLLCMLCCAMGVNSDYFRMYNGPWICDIIYIMGEVWRTTGRDRASFRTEHDRPLPVNALFFSSRPRANPKLRTSEDQGREMLVSDPEIPPPPLLL